MMEFFAKSEDGFGFEDRWVIYSRKTNREKGGAAEKINGPLGAAEYQCYEFSPNMRGSEYPPFPTTQNTKCHDSRESINVDYRKLTIQSNFSYRTTMVVPTCV